MPNWETLKKLTGSRFAQYFILVPIIGWLLIYQNTFADLLSKALGIDIETGLSWELLVFYLGLVLLGIASALFRSLGPEPVLNHDGLQAFVDNSEKFLTRDEFNRFCEQNNIEIPKEVRIPGSGVGQILDGTREQWVRLNKEGITNALCVHYRHENVSRPKIRTAISLVFFLGAALTLVPTVATVFWVLGQLGHQALAGS